MFCCCALIVLVLTAAPARADAISLRDYFRACGIGDDDFARFSDDRQMADEELDVLRRIAVRLRDCPADSLSRMMASNSAIPPRAEAGGRRGQPLHVRGDVESIEAVTQVVAGGAVEPLLRCTLRRDASPHRAMIYVAELPEKWKNTAAGERMAADAVFVKYVPGERDESLPVLVAPRLLARAAGPLGDLDFDRGLFEGIRDNAPVTAADSGAFYRLLALTKKGRRGAAAARCGVARCSRCGGATVSANRPRERAACFAWPASPAASCACRSTTRPRPPGSARTIILKSTLSRTPCKTIRWSSARSNCRPACRWGGRRRYGEPVEVTGFFLKTWQYPTGLTAGRAGRSSRCDTRPCRLPRC